MASKPLKTATAICISICGAIVLFSSITDLRVISSVASGYQLSPLRPYPPNDQNRIQDYSPVVVGPRKYQPQYHGRGCNSSELIAAVSRARIKDDGPSRRTVDKTLPGDELDLSLFAFSYDLDGCPAPHLYTPQEACDLLHAFGGVMFRGDSLVRHVVNALFMVLTGRTDGAVLAEKERCRGDAMFDDGPAICRSNIVSNSASMTEPVCGGSVTIFYDRQSYRGEGSHTRPDSWQSFISRLDVAIQVYSPIFISGNGLHFHFNTHTGILGYVRPFISRFKDVFPRPVGLWMGVHAPAVNKPERYLIEQGPQSVQLYNAEIGQAIDMLSPGEIIQRDGVLKMIDWYNVTDGAVSFDGTHYAYQVNMEKALILLNLLDAVWGEAKDIGNLYRATGLTR